MKLLKCYFTTFLFSISFFVTSIYTIHAQSVNDTIVASQYLKKADSLFIEQKYKSSTEFFSKALSIYKKEKVWEKVAHCYNKISTNHKYIPDLKNSLESANNALEISQQYLNKNNRHEARAYDNIGHYYELSTSDYKKASEYFNKAFEIRKKIFPENHEDIALSYDKLGLLFFKKKGEVSKTLENYKKSLAIRKKIFDKDHIAIAASYKGLANIFRFQGKYKKAILYYNKELKIRIQKYGENHISIATLYRELADVYMSLSEYEKSESLLKKALEIRSNSNVNDRKALGILYNTFGTLYQTTGKHDISVNYYKKSLTLLIELFGEENINVAGIYFGLGKLYRIMGFNDKALYYQYKALKICLAKSKKNPNLGIIYNEIGATLELTGEYEKAFQFYKKSRDLVVEKFGKDHFQVSIGTCNMANIYREQENYEKALELLQTSLSIEINNLGERNPNIALDYMGFGNVYLAKKQYTKASDYYLKALAIQQSIFGNDHNDVAYSFERLGELNKKIKKFDTAMLYFNEALDINKYIYSEPNQFIAASYEQIGQLYNETKAYQKALLTFKKAEKANTKNAIDTLNVNSLISNSLNINQLLNITNGKAKTYMALYKQGKSIKDLTNAIVLYQQADTLINHLRKTHTNYKDKIAFSKTAKNIYLGAITAQLLAYKHQKHSKALEEAFYYAEKSKSNTLKEFLTNSNAKSFAGLPESIVALEKELRTYDSFYQSKIIEEQSKKQIDSSKITYYENELFRINRRQDSLTDILEKEYPKYYQLTYKNDIVTVSKIQEQLDDRTTILEFFTSDSTTYAFTISKNDITVQELSTPKLTKQVETFRKSIIAKDTEAFKTQSHTLYRQLIAPISKKLVGDQLIIIPDESLWHLNFELLLTQNNGSNNPSLFPYLLKEYAITYANSTNLLFSPVKNNVTSEIRQECLAFSFSDSTQTTDTRAISLSTFRNSKMDLPGTREEIRKISDIVDGQYYYGSQAIEANFKKNVGQYNILHLALHGEVDNERPENSKLFFTKSKDTIEDNLLYSHELFALDIPAELTVLSACNTGTGKIAKGEGIMSLGTAFQYAGTKSLLLTSWEVSDTTTPELMKYFYANLKAGMNKGKALQQAKLQYLSTANTNRLDPFYWGAFYLVGDPAPMHFNNASILYWSVGIGIVLLLLFIGFWYRKRKV